MTDFKHSQLLREFSSQNPAVFDRLRDMESRSKPKVESVSHLQRHMDLRMDFMLDDRMLMRRMEYALPRRRLLSIVLLLAGLFAFGVVAGPAVVRFVAGNWKLLLLCVGATSVGAALVLILSRVGSQPLRDIQPPAADTEEPLKELERLADRTSARLKTAYRIQVALVIGVFTGFAAVVSWSMLMVNQKRLTYAATFGSGGIAMLVLAKWKWQPFERMSEARRLADQADVLGTALRLRIRTIEQIRDPEVRAKAQWEAVADYIKLS